MPDHIAVLNEGRELRFTFDEMLRFNGGRSPGGVAAAYKALEAVLPLLGGGAPVERRALEIRSAFAGPGVRDAFELVTRAVTEGRYAEDPSIARPEHGPARERFVFEIGLGDRRLVAALRGGFVPDEFVTLLRVEGRSPEQEQRLSELKDVLADGLMAVPGREAYEVTAPDGPAAD